MDSYDEHEAITNAVNRGFSYLHAVAWVKRGMPVGDMTIADARAAYMSANVCGALGDNNVLCNLAIWHQTDHAVTVDRLRMSASNIEQAIYWDNDILARWPR